MRRERLIGGVLAASLLLAACGSEVAAVAASMDSGPAVEAVALPFHDVVDDCMELGHEIKAITDVNNCVDYQYCVFSDGSECKAEDILMGTCGKAQICCAQQGYEIGMRDGLLSYIFDDGSYCKEMNYVFGECTPAENYD